MSTSDHCRIRAGKSGGRYCLACIESLLVGAMVQHCPWQWLSDTLTSLIGRTAALIREEVKTSRTKLQFELSIRNIHDVDGVAGNIRETDILGIKRNNENRPNFEMSETVHPRTAQLSKTQTFLQTPVPSMHAFSAALVETCRVLAEPVHHSYVSWKRHQETQPTARERQSPGAEKTNCQKLEWHDC